MLLHSSTTANLLVASLTSALLESILDEWTWLIGMEKRPLLVTACGDVFVEDLQEGTIHFLDVSKPELSLVSANRQLFETLLDEPAFVATCFHPDRVETLRAKGSILKKDQIYGFTTPLSLGGQISLDNMGITDVEVHFSICGQIERQLADVPTGARINGIEIEKVPRKKYGGGFGSSVAR
jgi:hypothetical protein